MEESLEPLGLYGICPQNMREHRKQKSPHVPLLSIDFSLAIALPTQEEVTVQYNPHGRHTHTLSRSCEPATISEKILLFQQKLKRGPSPTSLQSISSDW